MHLIFKAYQPHLGHIVSRDFWVYTSILYGDKEHEVVSEKWNTNPREALANFMQYLIDSPRLSFTWYAPLECPISWDVRKYPYTNIIDFAGWIKTGIINVSK